MLKIKNNAATLAIFQKKISSCCVDNKSRILAKLDFNCYVKEMVELTPIYPWQFNFYRFRKKDNL